MAIPFDPRRSWSHPGDSDPRAISKPPANLRDRFLLEIDCPRLSDTEPIAPAVRLLSSAMFPGRSSQFPSEPRLSSTSESRNSSAETYDEK